MNHENRFDILRLMAAWGVLYFHTYPLLGSKQTDLITENWKYDSLGGISVSVFFVISGYLVTNSIANSSGALDFLKKRALRIYPALIFVTLLSVFILGPLATSLPITDFFSEKITWNYLKNSIGYNIKYELPGVFENNQMSAVNGSLWSLNLEIKAYLGLLFLWLIPFGMNKKLIITCAFLSFVYFIRPVSEYGLNNRLFGLSYFSSKYFLMFAIGGLLSAYKDELGGPVLRSFGTASLLLIFSLAFFDVRPLTSLMYHWFFAVACIWISKHWLFLPIIPNKIGDLSYGVYLFSFPIQQVLIQYGFQNKPVSVFIFASTVVTIAFALISWHFVEKPFLRSKVSSKPRVHT